MWAICKHNRHLTHCANDIVSFGRLKPAFGTPDIFSVVTFFGQTGACIPLNVTLRGCTPKCYPTQVQACAFKNEYNSIHQWMATIGI